MLAAETIRYAEQLRETETKQTVLKCLKLRPAEVVFPAAHYLLLLFVDQHKLQPVSQVIPFVVKYCW